MKFSENDLSLPLEKLNVSLRIMCEVKTALLLQARISQQCIRYCSYNAYVCCKIVHVCSNNGMIVAIMVIVTAIIAVRMCIVTTKRDTLLGNLCLQ
jgi:hypothetical protein